VGARREPDVLRNRPGALRALIDAASEADRLVLLGDLIELRHGPLREALAAAQPVLEQLGSGLRPGAEVVIVPGNHDHRLLRPWLGRRSADGLPPPLGLESPVDWREGEPLQRIAGWLGPVSVRGAYPGVWLADDVYAMHGHYADRETTVPILERLGSGTMARLLAEANGRPRSAEDYETALGPMYAWIDAVAEQGGLAGRGGGGLQVRAWRRLDGSGGPRLSAWAISAGLGAFVYALNRAGIGPLRPDVSGPELRRAGLRAVAQVLAALEIPASHVISGHTHRAGPLPGDEPSEWVAGSGAQLLNTGSWLLHERAFLGDDPARSPYRAGFAAVLEDEGPPALVNLLDPA
jgi:hypothetical protein